MRLTLLALLLAAALARADDKTKLRAALKDSEPAEEWIYDDLAKGFADAKASGRPLMVVFRCVP